MDDNSRNQYPLGEPSVLDYVKSKIFFWRKEQISVPDSLSEIQELIPPQEYEDKSGISKLSWRVLTAIGLGFFAQLANQVTGGVGITGSVLYLTAAGLVVWAFWREELGLPFKAEESRSYRQIKINWVPLILGFGFALAAFWTLSANRFTLMNTGFWLLGIFLTAIGVWQFPANIYVSIDNKISRVKEALSDKKVRIKIIQFVIVLGIGIFFKVYQFGEVVPEMVSDHAEKLLNVSDLLNGETKIFFPGSAGRESLQIFLIALTAKITGLGVSFISMKLGTVLVGILMLPYIYLLGKEIGNHRVGLIAMFLIGIASWPNILARVALSSIL